MSKTTARDLLLFQRPTNDIERARQKRAQRETHNAALAAELRAQQRAKELSQ